MSDLTADEQLIHYLRERDTPCPLCGYNLRALTRPRCPECGKSISLTVGLVDRYMTMWISLFVALAAAAGAGVLLAPTRFFDGDFPFTFRSKFGRLVGNIAGNYFFCAIPLTAVALRYRRRFLRLDRRWQKCAGVVALAASALAFLIAFAGVS